MAIKRGCEKELFWDQKVFIRETTIITHSSYIHHLTLIMTLTMTLLTASGMRVKWRRKGRQMVPTTTIQHITLHLTLTKSRASHGNKRGNPKVNLKRRRFAWLCIVTSLPITSSCFARIVITRVNTKATLRQKMANTLRCQINNRVQQITITPNIENVHIKRSIMVTKRSPLQPHSSKQLLKPFKLTPNTNHTSIHTTTNTSSQTLVRSGTFE